MVVDGKGQELSKSIKGKLMILRMRGIELGASEDDGFWQEQGGSVRGAELPVDDDETLLMQSYSNSYRLP